MEIRSNNVLIGGFALIVVLAAFLFSFWLARVQINQTFDYYEVVFGGSVSGLTDGGSVQYNGIRVGKVMDLRLDEKDPSRVIALIQTEATTPVKTDTKVSLQFTGLTGVALIQLEGGSRSAPRLEPKEGETYAKIIAEPSAFQEIFKSAPAVLTNVNELIEKLQTVVTQNQKNVTGIVKNIETLTGELAGSSVDIKETLRNVNGITRNVKNASDSLER
ncbi:MAG: MCE family protein, partial [Parvibaculaceae bacterium]|nr:MCE family protein [Parvibaculaceae bacterium]